MGYWKDLAAKIDVDKALAHPWADLLRKTLGHVRSDMVETLTKSGELDSYIAVQVDGAIRDYERYREQGDDEATAQEMALDSLLPKEPDETDEWEIEGGLEDQAAALEDFLFGQ